MFSVLTAGSLISRPVTYPLLTRASRITGSGCLSLATWIGDFPDPIAFLDAVFHSRSISAENSINNTFYASPELDRVLDAARVEPDPAARAAMYQRAERMLYDDAPWVWEYHQLSTEVTQPYVRGYAPHPVWGRDYTSAWLDVGLDGAPVPR